MGYDLSVLAGCGWLRGIKLVNGTSVATGDKVAINIHGHFDAGMPELLLHIDGALTLAQQEAGKRVSNSCRRISLLPADAPHGKGRTGEVRRYPVIP